MFVHEILDRARIEHPDVEAVRDSTGSWTYRELDEASHACAGWLSEQDIRPGSRLVVRAVADRRVAALLYACSRTGVIFVPVSPDTRPYQLAHILEDAAPALVLWDIDQVCPTPREAASRRTGPALVDDEWPAMFFYTSGSVARPKAVVCPHARVSFAAHAIAARLRYRPGDIVYCRLPLSFDYGLYQMLLCAIGGATLVLADGASDARLVPEIRYHRATIVPVVPALAGMLARLASRDSKLTDVRLFTNTGEALTPSHVAGLRAHFPNAGIQLMFGLTECKRVSILDVDADRAKPGSMGTPLDGTEVRIVDPDGRAVEPGVPGEIVVAGPHVMAGYWRDPALTERVFRPDPGSGRSVLHTGDIGHLDEDGHLYFLGRKDHIFKQRGMRTSVAEIEAAALDIPGVLEAVVVPPGPGRAATLCVVTELAVEQIRRGLRDRLEPAKVPDHCHVVSRLPIGPTGKVDRVALATALGDS